MEYDIKRAIVYSAGVEGYFADDKNFVGLNVAKERRYLLDAIRGFATKVGKFATRKEADKLVCDIQRGQLSVEVVESFEKIENKKRMSKMKVKIHRGMLETIAEEAMTACEDCSRNMKKCLLRRAMLDCNIAKYHDSENICCYKQI